MPDFGIQTHRLTLTHGLTHAAKQRNHNRLNVVRESRESDFNPMRVERRNICVIKMCVRVPAHARAHGRVRKGAETDSPDSRDSRTQQPGRDENVCDGSTGPHVLPTNALARTGGQPIGHGLRPVGPRRVRGLALANSTQPRFHRQPPACQRMVNYGHCGHVF